MLCKTPTISFLLHPVQPVQALSEGGYGSHYHHVARGHVCMYACMHACISVMSVWDIHRVATRTCRLANCSPSVRRSVCTGIFLPHLHPHPLHARAAASEGHCLLCMRLRNTLRYSAVRHVHGELDRVLQRRRGTGAGHARNSRATDAVGEATCMYYKVRTVV